MSGKASEKAFRIDTRGGSFLEYIIIVGVVALLSITAFQRFEGALASKLEGQGARVGAIGTSGRAGESSPTTTSNVGEANGSRPAEQANGESAKASGGRGLGSAASASTSSTAANGEGWARANADVAAASSEETDEHAPAAVAARPDDRSSILRRRDLTLVEQAPSHTAMAIDAVFLVFLLILGTALIGYVRARREGMKPEELGSRLRHVAQSARSLLARKLQQWRAEIAGRTPWTPRT